MNKNGSHSSPIQATADAYVSGALEAGEAERFELRLLEDQQAREAVANSVRLLENTLDALTHSTTVTRPLAATSKVDNERWRAIDWVVTLGGACVLIVGLTLAAVQTGRVNNEVAQDQNADPSADQLALIWGEVLTTSPLAQSNVEGATEEPSVDELLSGLNEEEFLVSDSPDWMLAAVGELSARDDMDHELETELQ